jgi:GTP cyclohydrolase I
VDLTTFAADGYDEIVAASRLPFYSLCEHHLLPFHGLSTSSIPAASSS